MTRFTRWLAAVWHNEWPVRKYRPPVFAGPPYALPAKRVTRAQMRTAKATIKRITSD